MALQDPNAWRVEAIRFSFFYAEPQDGRSKGWWKSITDVDAEVIQNRQQIAEYSESGSYGDGHLELKVVFNRIDWILSYPFAGMPEADQVVQYAKVAGDLCAKLERWVGDAPGGIIRVAFGAVLLLPVVSPVEGNKILADYLPSFKFDVNNVTDFFIQLNRPVSSHVVDGLLINDLIKLGAIAGQFMQIGNSGMPSMTLNHMVRAEFDINTAADRAEPIPQSSVSLLFGAMLERSLQILREGVAE